MVPPKRYTYIFGVIGGTKQVISVFEAKKVTWEAAL